MNVCDCILINFYLWSTLKFEFHMIFMSQNIILLKHVFQQLKKCKNHSLQVGSDWNRWQQHLAPAQCLLTPALTHNFENKTYNLFADISFSSSLSTWTHPTWFDEKISGTMKAHAEEILQNVNPRNFRFYFYKVRRMSGRTNQETSRLFSLRYILWERLLRLLLYFCSS